MAKRGRGYQGQSVLQNAVKTLFANIRFSSVDEPVRTIVVTSSIPGEGKTVISTNLAKTIAGSGKSVLIVECDMRKRSLASALDIHPEHGLYAVLTDAVPVTQAIVPTKTDNLYFLDVEPSIPNPADIVASKRFSRLLVALREHYDYIVLDTPPVGGFVDAAVLASISDGVVFVVRENFTKRTDVVNAFDQLKKADANVLGTVLNCCDESSNPSAYYYHGYYSQVTDDLDRSASAHSQHAAEARDEGAPAEGKRFK